MRTTTASTAPVNQVGVSGLNQSAPESIDRSCSALLRHTKHKTHTTPLYTRTWTRASRSRSAAASLRLSEPARRSGAAAARPAVTCCSLPIDRDRARWKDVPPLRGPSAFPCAQGLFPSLPTRSIFTTLGRGCPRPPVEPWEAASSAGSPLLNPHTHRAAEETGPSDDAQITTALAQHTTGPSTSAAPSSLPPTPPCLRNNRRPRTTCGSAPMAAASTGAFD